LELEDISFVHHYLRQHDKRTETTTECTSTSGKRIASSTAEQSLLGFVGQILQYNPFPRCPNFLNLAEFSNGSLALSTLAAGSISRLLCIVVCSTPTSVLESQQNEILSQVSIQRE
jgi:hypothetical protein